MKTISVLIHFPILLLLCFISIEFNYYIWSLTQISAIFMTLYFVYIIIFGFIGYILMATDDVGSLASETSYEIDNGGLGGFEGLSFIVIIAVMGNFSLMTMYVILVKFIQFNISYNNKIKEDIVKEIMNS